MNTCKRGRYFLPLLMAGALAVSGCAGKWAPIQESVPLDLVILHTNDTHAHVAGIGKYGSAALDDAASVGGLARIAAAVNAAKAASDNVIALDAGDQFQGTLFFTTSKGPMLAELNRSMPWDAMTLGNHEFDDGCEALARFMELNPIPMLAANLAPEKACPLYDGRAVPHIIKEVRGVKVGIIGLASDDTTAGSSCEHTRFDDAAATLAREVETLRRQGVRHIIAVTHLGLATDRELARSVDGVDVIVGGHSHDLLGPDSPAGPYPIVERSPNGLPVLVVTAKRATEYLGELNVSFDADGVPVRWNGEAVRLEPGMERDAALSERVRHYASMLDGFRSAILGYHDIDMADGMDLCRQGDCLSGMMTVDAMLEFARPYGAQVALFNGGAIRAALPKGDISRGDVLSVHPFGNVFVQRELAGEQLLAALEHGVAEDGGIGAHLLHTAGLRYELDASLPAGHRVLKVEMLDEAGKASPLDLKARYGVILSSFLAGGGDGYEMLKAGQPMDCPEPIDVDVFEAYVKRHSPLEAPAGPRIIRR